jgi:hypothetical protein
MFASRKLHRQSSNGRSILITDDKSYGVGFAKPPTDKQFTKGKSGNPKGRPKGSKNIGTILSKAGRERIKITKNGVTRYISKIEACVLQLINQAASGELRAIREFLYWNKLLVDSELTILPTLVPHERDRAVMENLLKRIRQSDQLSENTPDSVTGEPFKENE